MSENEKANTTPQLSKEESAFFAKSFWTAVETPKWPRQRLIEFGHLVNSKTPLAKFSEAQLATFLPYLQQIAASFGAAVAKIVKRTSPLQTDEIAHLIRILWIGFITPCWTPDDLIEFGKAVFTKTPLSKLSEHQFAILFPHLTTIANKVGSAMLSQSTSPAAPAAPAAPADPADPAPPSQEETNG